MLKILNQTQIKNLDQLTIQQEKISSWDLMERAATTFTLWFNKKIPKTKQIFIFCGTGNNGGDGLAIARLLSELGFLVVCYILNFTNKKSQDFRLNYQKLKTTPVLINEITEFTTLKLALNSVIIDAIFGTGLNKPLSEPLAKIIQLLNSKTATKIAVDLPSGLKLEKTKTAFKADYTFSFELPKLSFLFSEHQDFIGELILGSIGLSSTGLKQMASDYYWLQPQDLKILPRKKHHYKNLSGHCLIVGASYGKIGSVLLSAKAAFRIGAGLVTLTAPDIASTPLHSYLPESMFLVATGTHFIEKIPTTTNYQSIALGMGMGAANQTQLAFKNFLLQQQKQQTPLVLDADALTILALNPSWLQLLHPKTILTPHIGEFTHLFGNSKTSFERLLQLKTQAQKLGIWIILKGSYTAVASPAGKIYFNSTGTPALATAGSGDVFSGILAGFLAQSLGLQQSAFSAVLIQGLAAQLACSQKKIRHLIASDIIDFLPQILPDY